MTKYTLPERRILIQALIHLSQSEGWPIETRNEATRMAVRIARIKITKRDRTE